MYFVADVNNKLYFAETDSGHQQNIKDLKNKGLWPE
jgi:cell division protein YceG involved in septum cleavage